MRLVLIFTVMIVTMAVSVEAQECIFQIKDDDSLQAALEAFHDVMADLWHGPAAEGNLLPLRARIEDLRSRRDAVMGASLPEKHKKVCVEFSVKATEFSQAIDQLAELTNGKASDDDIKVGFSKVHDAYRAMRQALVTLEEMIESFHDLLQPLWHEAYPAEDIAAIKEATPKLKVRAKLIVSVAGRSDDENLLKNAESLLSAVETLEEAIEVDDHVSILKALEIVHEAYHTLSDDEES